MKSINISTNKSIDLSVIGCMRIIRSLPNARHYGEDCYQAIMRGNDGKLHLAVVCKIGDKYNTFDSCPLSSD